MPTAAAPHDDPQPMLGLFATLFGDQAIERLQIAYLDHTGRVLALAEPEPGGIDGVGFPLRRIVANALALRCAGLLLAHNHPSGDPSPSPNDIAATRRLADVAHRLDIRVVDHFVIAGAKWTSFRALGLL